MRVVGSGLAGNILSCSLLARRQTYLAPEVPWRKAGPPNHHDDAADLDQRVASKEFSIFAPEVLHPEEKQRPGVQPKCTCGSRCVQSALRVKRPEVHVGFTLKISSAPLRRGAGIHQIRPSLEYSIIRSDLDRVFRRDLVSNAHNS